MYAQLKNRRRSEFSLHDLPKGWQMVIVLFGTK